MKIYFTIIALCFACSSFAQIEKGRSYVSGQVGGGSTGTNYDYPNLSTGPLNQKSFNVDVSYGYVFASSWAVALSGSIANYSTNYINQTRSSGKVYGISPYVRKYFSIGEKFYFHLDGGVNYLETKSKYKIPPSATSTDGTKSASVYVSPGLTYFLSNHFSLTANLGSLNYTHSRSTGGSPYQNTTSNGFNTSVGFSSITFGAAIFF
jgi:hypothetical protein